MKTIVDRTFFETVVKKTPLSWQADPTAFLWLRAPFEDGWLRIRINPQFPDGAAYSFALGDGFVEFDDFPPTWERGPLKWPDGVKQGE